MNWLKKLLGKRGRDVRKQTAGLNHSSDIVRKFSAMSMEDRTRYFMHMNEPVDSRQFEVVHFALKHDEDWHVKLAALKRLHHFNDHPQVDQIIEELEKQRQMFEPYLSMALFRMERIDQDEYNRRVGTKSQQ